MERLTIEFIEDKIKYKNENESDLTSAVGKIFKSILMS